jgi:hypothetical protein
LLATVDWLLHQVHVEPTIDSIAASLTEWPGGRGAGARKFKLFNDRMIGLALSRLEQTLSI